jgi:hypothetical protein
VDEYINQFQELIDVAEYNDDKTIVIKFHKGLDPTVQNKVTLIRDNTPDFEDPEGWYEAIQKVAWNTEANEAFIKSSQNTSHTPTKPMANKITLSH